MATVEASGVRSLVPRFYWGNIIARKHEYVRGPGYQFYRIVPLDIVQIDTELGITEYTPEAVDAAVGNLWGCVERLRQERADRVILGGAPVSIGLGRARVSELLAGIEEKAGVPADAPLEALVAGMTRLGLRTLVVGSRWANEVNAALVDYLTDAGLEVLGITSRGQWNKEAHEMSLEEGLKVALEVGREAAACDTRAEAIFVPGGAAMTLHVVPLLEEEFGKPAFTNLNAEVWNGLVRPGVIEPVAGWGRLLAER